MLRTQSKVYNTLYDWQKPFIGMLVDKLDIEDNPTDKTAFGFFLRMGIGKTKLMTAIAEIHDSDCVIMTSILPKVLETNIKGSWGEELELAGYKIYYSHLLYQPPALKPLKSGKIRARRVGSEAERAENYYNEFVDDFMNKRKIVYACNYESIMSKKGFAILHMLAGGNESFKRNIQKRQGKIEGYKNITWLFDESHKIKSKDSQVSMRVHSMLTKSYAPGIKVIRDNYFKDNIKHVYLGTGTPFTVGYVDFFQQLRLMGHDWEFDDFFDDYCVEDIEAKKYNIFSKSIKEYKNEEQLLDVVEQFAFFARTENYYPFLPERRQTTIWCRQDESYRLMSWNNIKNDHYRVYDDYICDTPATFKMRLRQLASGFMGNAVASDYYSTWKVDKLQEIIENNEDNYVVFYNYTPELFMIMAAAEEAGYVYDIYNGKIKDLSNFYNDKIKSKKLIIANIKSGSVGLNLQTYKNAIFYSLPDVWSDFEQGVGRIERTGQESPFVDVYVLMTIGTVEGRMWNNLMVGKDYTDKMFERDYIYKQDQRRLKDERIRKVKAKRNMG